MAGIYIDTHSQTREASNRYREPQTHFSHIYNMQTDGTVYNGTSIPMHHLTHIKLASNDTCLHKIAYYLSIMTSQPTRSSDPHPGSSWQSTSKKAFDSVPHISVVEGAIQRGVRGRTLECIIAFLSSRTYHIRVGNTLSPNRTNNIGVP